MLNKMMMLAVGVFASAGVAHANEVPCNYCNSTQMAAMARQAGIGTHYVYDTYVGNVMKFHVEREPAGNGRYTWGVDSIEVEPVVQETVQEIAAFRAATNGTMAANLTLTAPPDAGTAFGAAQEGGARTHFMDWVYTQPSSFANFFPAVGIILSGDFHTALNIFKSQQIQTTYTVTFADGSRITLTYDALTNTSTIVEGSAKDAQGNKIPTKPEDVVEIRFDFSRDPTGNAQRRMEDWLVQLGIHMAGETGPFHVIACVGSPGGPYTCTRI